MPGRIKPSLKRVKARTTVRHLELRAIKESTLPTRTCTQQLEIRVGRLARYNIHHAALHLGVPFHFNPSHKAEEGTPPPQMRIYTKIPLAESDEARDVGYAVGSQVVELDAV